MVKLIQPSMAGGEVSSAVGARVDLAKRAVAVEKAENYFSAISGGMLSRPGQQFVARCKPGSTAYRILEFEFNTSQTFVLELGETYMRFHTGGEQILDSAAQATISGATQANPVVITATAHGFNDGDEVYIADVAGMTELNGRNFLVANKATNTLELQDLDGNNVDGTGYTAYSSGGTATPPYEVTTPWADDDLFDLKYAQSGDVMTLTHPDYTPRELVRIANDDWTLSEISFVPEQTHPTGINAESNRLPDATQYVENISSVTLNDPVEINTGTGHDLVRGQKVFISGVGGTVELNNFLYRVKEVLGPQKVSLQYADTGEDVDATGFTTHTSGGEMITHASERKSTTPGDIINEPLKPRQYAVTAVSENGSEESLRGTSQDTRTITNITQADPAVVTTSEGHGLSDLDEIEISGVSGMTELNDERFKVIRLSATTFSLKRLDGTDVDSTSYTAYSSGGSVNTLFVNVYGSAEKEWQNSIRWTAVTGAVAYNVYGSDSFGVLGFLGQTSNTFFEDNNLNPDYAESPPREFNPFDDFIDGTDKQPSAVGFFEQRRWFANSNDFPNRFWASQIGNFDNFSRALPPLDDDSIIASIAARRINSIEHIVPLTDIILLTSGGEYRILAGESGTITPNNLGLKPQSYYGSSKVRPIVAGEVALFVTPGQGIRDFSYEFSADKFTGKDITILARHLFDSRTVVDWDFAPSPYNIGFVVRDDGIGLVLTYDPSQDLYAWTRAVTKGKYKSTCVIREGNFDVIYVVVERSINGVTQSFIERMDTRQFEDLQDAFCVDAGLTLDNPVDITGMTAANPVVVTAPSHGFSNGDTVDVSDVMEKDTSVNLGESLSADYNGTGFTIANVTANTFELQNAGADYDGSAFAVYSSGGKVRKAVTTVTGLWHLEGETVVAAANGYSVKDLTVANGSITLPEAASRIHIGLGYFCRLVTLPLSTYADGRTIIGRAKNINRLTVQVDRTMGLWHGPDVDNMREAKFGLPAKWGQPLPMVTEDIDVTMKPDWDKKKQIVIEQRDPLPMSILALVPDANIGGN